MSRKEKARVFRDVELVLGQGGTTRLGHLGSGVPVDLALIHQDKHAPATQRQHQGPPVMILSLSLMRWKPHISLLLSFTWTVTAACQWQPEHFITRLQLPSFPHFTRPDEGPRHVVVLIILLIHLPSFTICFFSTTLVTVCQGFFTFFS